MDYNDSKELAFNKDLAKLMELQRIEYLANNFAIENNQQQRLNALKRWYGMLKGILMKLEKTKEIQQINKYLEQSKPVKYHGEKTMNTNVLDDLHDYLNQMNIICNVEFTQSKKTDFLEPEQEWN